MPKRLIHSVASKFKVAEFDELKGNTLSYVYPENPSPVIKSHQREDIAELCLPDGGHKRSSDCIYILLTAERNVPLYGFAYFRNRESAAEKRGAKQLAILVISTSPYFDRFKPFLSVAVEEYLDHHQSKAIVHQLYGALEKSYRRTRRLAVSRHKSYDSLDLVLQSSDDDIEGTQDESDSRPPAPMIAKQKARPASARLALRGRPSSYDPKSTFGAARDAEPTNFMTHSSVSVQDSNGSEAAGSGSDNDMGGSSGGDDDAREDAHSETGSQAAAPVDDLVNRNSVCYAKLKSDTQGRGVQNHLGLLSSSCTYTMHLWGRMFVMQPLSRLQSNEFGGVSLKEVVLKFRVQTMALWSALVGLRRVLVCGPESQASTVGGLVLATPLLLGPLGALIIPNLVPYATLANVDPLTKHSSYVCGTTNGLFATKEDWYDLVIDPNDGKLVMSSTSPMDRNLLKVQGGDLAFITRILDGIENGKREEDWVRFEFSTFTQDFLDSVREVELERQTRKLKEEGASTASSASLSPVHGHSASDASSLATMGLLDGIADVEGSRSRLRSVSMWRQKTKTSFLKRKGPRSASEKLAKTFAGSPLWLRYRWIQLNPESYTSSRKHLSRVHVVTVLADPLHAAKLEPKPSVALENQNVLQKREIQDDEDEERQAELPLLKPETKWPSQLEDEEEEGNGGDDDVDSNVDEDTGHETSENPQERQQKRKSRLQQARTAPMVPLRRSPSSQDQAYRSWSANRRSLNSEEYGSDDEDEVDDEDPSGASKWVLLKGRWQRVTVLMQEDIALKVFRKSDWVEAFTEGGERFWHNLKSGESTWEQPPRTVSTIVA
ncbi:Protein DENND6-like [Hondaea fermentalgiana]|uniref:Protein DENND6-like n=1 Tax=Hondaea fermentalgiana TaxID=2315210 RepID=A0A2R5GPL4_9STRA|nr:Protein DENND6-like [Hondaea fermentalgiana]|eukprot:GBG31718.1 Protein DENND6-like [Hondaea fermentalgiana]